MKKDHSDDGTGYFMYNIRSTIRRVVQQPLLKSEDFVSFQERVSMLVSFQLMLLPIPKLDFRMVKICWAYSLSGRPE